MISIRFFYINILRRIFFLHVFFLKISIQNTKQETQFASDILHALQRDDKILDIFTE